MPYSDSILRSREWLGVPALRLAAFVSPIEEALELVSIFPREAKEFAHGHIRGFGSEESFKPPAEVWAIPGSEAVAFCGEPVVPQHLEHSVWAGRTTSPDENILADQTS